MLHGGVLGGNKIGESNCVRIGYFGIVMILASCLVVGSMLISNKLARAMGMKFILHVISLRLHDGAHVIKGRGRNVVALCFGQLAMCDRDELREQMSLSREVPVVEPVYIAISAPKSPSTIISQKRSGL